jgi:hypothetical protein
MLSLPGSLAVLIFPLPSAGEDIEAAVEAFATKHKFIHNDASMATVTQELHSKVAEQTHRAHEQALAAVSAVYSIVISGVVALCVFRVHAHRLG